MKLFFNTKKKTMPQQVKRNEEDIETLKNKGFIVKPRGAYDATKTYHKFDLVSYDGDSYIFVSETDAVGIPVTNKDYWQLYTSGGLSIEIGTTETLSAGSNASVTNSGTSTEAVLNFGIPQGEKGEQGPAGQDGQDGTDGVGVPSGGTTGQVLKKKSNTDYDTEWASDTSGMENPMTSEGDLIYGGPTGTPTALAKGTAGQVLTMKQNGTGPEWANASSGTTKYMHKTIMDNAGLDYIEIYHYDNSNAPKTINNVFDNVLFVKGYMIEDNGNTIVPIMKYNKSGSTLTFGVMMFNAIENSFIIDNTSYVYDVSDFTSEDITSSIVY